MLVGEIPLQWFGQRVKKQLKYVLVKKRLEKKCLSFALKVHVQLSSKTIIREKIDSCTKTTKKKKEKQRFWNS
jgi:hypothetical protein